MSRIFRFVTALPVATAVVMAPVTASVAWTPTATSAPFDPPAPPATIFEVGGAGWETLPESTMRAILGYRYDTPGNTFVNIEWPAYLGTLGDSVDQASDDLYALIGTTDGPEVAVGLSGSTLVMNEVMRRLDEDPNPPASPDKITFVIVGDAERGLIPAIAALTGPNLPLVNYTAKPIPVTAYNAIVVTGEYDGLADWPDRPWNLLAVANAWLGSPASEGYGEIHWDSIFNSLDEVPAENITTVVNAKGGTTINYLVPTPEVPLLYPLHAMGVPQDAIDVLNSVLKPIVDAGYSRNDPAWLKNLTGRSTTSQPSATTPAVSAVRESDPGVDVSTVKQPKAASAAEGSAPARPSAKRLPAAAATTTEAPTAEPADSRRAATGRAGATAR